MLGRTRLKTFGDARVEIKAFLCGYLAKWILDIEDFPTNLACSENFILCPGQSWTELRLTLKTGFQFDSSLFQSH